MIPFPRQEMQRLRWTPPLIEYFYQLDILLRAIDGTDSDAVTDLLVLASLKSQIASLQDDIEALDDPVSTEGTRDDPENEHRRFEMSLRRLENRVNDLEAQE